MNKTHLQYYLKCVAEGRVPGKRGKRKDERLVNQRKMEKANKPYHRERQLMYTELFKRQPIKRVFKDNNGNQVKRVYLTHGLTRREKQRIYWRNAVLKGKAYTKTKLNSVSLNAAVNNDILERSRELKRNNGLMNRRNKAIHKTRRAFYESFFCAKHECVKEVRYSNDKLRGIRVKYFCIGCNREAKKAYISTEHGRIKARLSKKARKHRIRAGGTLTAAMIHAVYELAGNKCECCYATNDLTLDHKIPVAIGGTNEMSNLGILCRSCNSIKNDRLLSYDELREKILPQCG